AVDALFLAVPAAAAPAVLDTARGLPAGTIVVDCTNPLRWDDGPVHTPPPEGSMAAHLAKRFPALRLIKAFNTFGAEFHDRPELGSAAADLYLAGDDAGARRGIAELARTLGYDPVDVGPLRNAAHLESLAILDPPRHRRQARPRVRVQGPGALKRCRRFRRSVPACMDVRWRALAGERSEALRRRAVVQA
ncbi:MAG TPA: hypothetical protein VF516_33765, partial [Kofleriaceae bacterium]